jgi:hypothetical protein
LEGSWGVAHAKKHDVWFKEPPSGFEGSFSLVTIANPNIVIAPSDVKLAEELHALEVFNIFSKVW